MRHVSLRLALIAGCALVVVPAFAQETPRVVVEPSPDAVEAEAAVPLVTLPIAEEAPIPAIWAPVPTDEHGRSAYGLYLSSRVAGFRGEHGLAADFLLDTQALTPEQPRLNTDAFIAGLFSGDFDAILRVAPKVQETPDLAEAGRLVGAIQSLAEGDGRRAFAGLKAQPFREPFGTLARYLAPSMAAAAGDWDAALQPVGESQDLFSTLVLRLQRARNLEARRRLDEAEAEFRALTAEPAGAALFNVEFGEFLERRGRRDEAAILYRAVLTGPAPDPQALIGLRRIETRGRPPAAPTPVEAAAETLDFASIQMTALDQHRYAVIYLRLAHSLSPSDDLTLRLGRALVADDQPGPAREAFARIGPADPILYASGQFSLALSLAEAERHEEALEALRRAAAAAPGQVSVTEQLAQQLLILERWGEALAVLNQPELNTVNQSPEIRFMRGAALERLGRIEEAENELWTALQAAPDNPDLLNHLGYLWVDTGRRVEQGAEMIARAHAAAPDNGNIQDSLGWAQYRQGQYDLAVETLEGAVAREPANAEIVDHLGDAYWQVGRRREATWQWNRVLTLEPDAEQRTEVERKLLNGLPEPTPVTVGGES